MDTNIANSIILRTVKPLLDDVRISLFAHCHTPFTLDCFNRPSTAIILHFRAGLTRFPSDLNK